jgi:hypothetical protein
VFLSNKYARWYFTIIETARREARVRTRSWQYQEHHMTPSSLGGSDEPDNLVLLTPREHYICHLLLTRMTIGEARSKMIFAFFRFSPKGQNINSSRAYERHI